MNPQIISLWTGLLQQTTSGTGGGIDPVGTFAPLGVAAAACLAFYLAWKSSERKADQERADRIKADDTLKQLIPVMVEMRLSLEKATGAGIAQAEATKAMVEAMKGMPDRETWYRLLDLVNRMDAANKNPPRRNQG